jgi:hypothetical protein
VELDEQSWRFFAGLHRLLLRVAGRMPDEWVTAMRRKLAGGEAFEVPDYVIGGMADQGLSLTAGEVALVREMTRAVFGRDPVWMEEGQEVAVSAETPGTDHRFFPVPAEVLATDAARIPATLDFTGGAGMPLLDLPPALSHLDDLVLRLTDPTDRSLPTAAGFQPGALSMARAWRFPSVGPPVDGVRVVLVEVADRTPAWDVAGDLQHELERAGEVDPQVEVFWRGDVLPPYHRAALEGSALFWAAHAEASPSTSGHRLA